MKNTSRMKIMLAVLMIFCLLPRGSAVAASTQDVNNGDSVMDEYGYQVTVSSAVDGYNLPHRDIFINSVETSNDVAVRSTENNLIVSANGYYYRNGSPVKTRGQVDVPTLYAVTDMAEEEKEQEIATM